MDSNKIVLGADHAGFELKEIIEKHLLEQGYSVDDLGTHSLESTDYPDHIHPVASQLEFGQAKFGIIVCGSGNGVAMTANKHRGVRAAIAWQTDIAALARQHNNANILALPARFITVENAIEMVDVFVKTEFEGGRHARRMSKIDMADESE